MSEGIDHDLRAIATKEWSAQGVQAHRLQGRWAFQPAQDAFCDTTSRRCVRLDSKTERRDASVHRHAQIGEVKNDVPLMLVRPAADLDGIAGRSDEGMLEHVVYTRTRGAPWTR